MCPRDRTQVWQLVIVSSDHLAKILFLFANFSILTFANIYIKKILSSSGVPSNKTHKHDHIPCSETVRLSLCPVLYWEMTRTEGPAPRIGWRVGSASPVVMTQASPQPVWHCLLLTPKLCSGTGLFELRDRPLSLHIQPKGGGKPLLQMPKPLWVLTPEHTNLDASLGVQGQGSPRASSSVVFRIGRCPELESHGCPK